MIEKRPQYEDSQRKLRELVMQISFEDRLNNVARLMNSIDSHFVEIQQTEAKGQRKISNIKGIILGGKTDSPLPLFFQAWPASFPSVKPILYLDNDTSLYVTQWSPHKSLTPAEYEEAHSKTAKGPRATKEQMIYILTVLGFSTLVEEALVSNGLEALYREHIEEIKNPDDILQNAQISAAISMYCDSVAYHLKEHQPPVLGH